MIRTPLCFASLLVLPWLSSAATAQTAAVLPHDLPVTNRFVETAAWGQVVSPAAVFDAAPLVLQQVYTSGPLRGHQVQSLEFRAYVPTHGAPAVRHGAAEMEVWCASSARAAWQTSAVLADNRGRDLTRVVDRRWVAFPPQDPVAAPPAPWTYRVAFDRPFLVQDASWMFELRVYDRESFDPAGWEGVCGTDYSGADHLGVTGFGHACTGVESYRGDGRRSQLGGVLYGAAARLSNVPAHLMACVFVVGRSATHWAGGALPVDLTSAGLTGCRLFVEPLVALPGHRMVPTRDDAGHILCERLPDDPALSGAWLYFQAVLGPNAAWNPAGVVLSSPVATAVLPPVVSIAHAAVVAPALGVGGPAGPVGALHLDAGLTTRVVFQ